MASEPRQGPLEVALSRSPFTQTGSWSMVDIAKLAVQIPVGMLSRYAAGRVNTHTVLVAEAMGMTFRMGKNGRSSLEKAFSKLSSVSTLNGSLYIGFGIEDFTREMIKSEAGAMLVGLCAALKECYTDDVAIEVMLEYARQTKADGQWMPSNMEWRNLLDACAGCLATSNFALRAEHLMQLAKGEQRILTFGAEGRKKQRGCSTPKSIADALSALAMLSNGRMEYVSLTGGPDGGWLAAVAEWFLDLKVKIVDDSSLEVLYTNHADDQDTQVTVLYLSQVQQDSGEKRTDQVAISDKTYKVSLEDVCKTFLPSDPEYNTSTVSGRLSWTSALRGAFGSDFERLMTRPNAFGTAIGSAAVLFSAIAEAHQDISPLYLGPNMGYSDSSYGQGLVAHVVQQFPELASLKKSMEEALRAPFDDAKRQYEDSIASLTASCNCQVCGQNLQVFGPGPDGKDNDQSDGPLKQPSDALEPGDEDAMKGTSKQYCCVVIAETIIGLCRRLSNVVIHAPDLQPTRAGFERSYGQGVHARRSRPPKGATRDLSLFAFCIDLNPHNIVLVDRAGAVRRKMRGLLELYTGRQCRDVVESASALCLNGISAFFSVLTPSHSETNDQVGQVHLVPGRISFEGKSYMRLVDRKMQATDELTVRDGSLTRPDYALTAQDHFTHRRLSVREGPVDLHCLMQFTRDVGADGESPIFSVGPFAFAAMLATCRGWVHCNSLRTGIGCAVTETASAKSYGMKGEWVEYKCEGRVIMIMRPRPGMQTLATLAFLMASQSWRCTYIVDSQCDSCCIRKALASNDDPERRESYFVYVS